MKPALAWVLLLAAPVAAQETPVEALVERVRTDLGDVDEQLDTASAAAAPRDPLGKARAAHVRAISDLEQLIRHVERHPGGS